MKPFLYLRALVYLKRITIALERIASAQERAVDPPRSKTKLAHVFTPTIEKMNQDWQEDRLGR